MPAPPRHSKEWRQWQITQNNTRQLNSDLQFWGVRKKVIFILEPQWLIGCWFSRFGEHCVNVNQPWLHLRRRGDVKELILAFTWLLRINLPNWQSTGRGGRSLSTAPKPHMNKNAIKKFSWFINSYIVFT